MPQDSSPMLRWFADLEMSDRPLVGGKGASLGELTHAGIDVPPGFVITTVAFEAFLAASAAAHDIRREVTEFDVSDDAHVAAASRSIREEISEMPVPPEIGDEILAAYRKLRDECGHGCVAVRSSATCEDSEEASFAGLQDTYLWVDGEDELIEKVRACWASLYNAESITYRKRLELPEDQLAMAVVVQSMVDARCAGVMFTRSPTTGDRSVIVIEGSWGLGSCLVSGEVTPDRWVVNKVTGEINTRDISTKATQHVRRKDGHGVSEEPVDDEHQDTPSVSDEELALLWEIARHTESHYGCPQDIEWAIPGKAEAAKPSVLLLQSRPETIWANRKKEPAARPMPKSFDHVLSAMSIRKE